MNDVLSNRERGSQIRAVARAINILEVLGQANGELSLGQIAGRVGLAKSTVHGLISTLRDFDYVTQSPLTGKYKLGVTLFELGNSVARNWDVRIVSVPYIQNLLEQTGRTVHLAVLDKGEVLYVDKRECHDTLRIVTQVGRRLPAHCSGVGKVLLAYLPINEARRIISQNGLPAFTKKTITDINKLEKELEQIREQGYALDNEEIMDSLRCIAAPIRNHEHKVVASISISGHINFLSGEAHRDAIEKIVETSNSISRDLGYKP